MNKKSVFTHALSFAAVAAVLLLNISCKKNSSPVQPKAPVKAFNNWVIDTLKTPEGYGVFCKSIWGSSSKDVYAVGFSDVQQGNIFHYDGKKWNDVTPSLPFNKIYKAVYGFGPNDVYVVGYKYWFDPELRVQTLILHYNGTIWEVNQSLQGNSLNYIHGKSSTDIWTCGMYGTLFHYDGAAWNKIPVDTLCTMGPIFDAPDGQVCIVYGYTKWPEMNDTTFYHYANIDGTKLVTLDTCITYNGYGGYETNFEFGNKGLWGLCGSEMYSAGTCLWKYNGSSWNVIYGAPDTYYEDIRGLSRNDIYIVGWSGIIRHYDGSDWQFIGHYGGQGINFYAVMPFEDEVFVSGDYQDNTYIVHSKVTLK